MECAVKRLLLLVLLSVGFAASAKEQVPDAKLVDDQVKQQIIQESIDSYPGNCPCPYNSARNGSRCGKRSAWSRAGGYAPICYKEEITDEMVQQWRGERSGREAPAREVRYQAAVMGSALKISSRWYSRNVAC